MQALVSIGEVMAEIRRSPSSDFKIGYAGDTFNTAVYCQRLLHNDERVSYVTRVGDDPLSSAWHQFARDEGLDLSAVSTDANTNIGIYSVSTDEQGERTFNYWRNQSAARQLFNSPDDLKSLPKARITYLSGISLAILSPEARSSLMGHLAKASESGETIVAFDSNFRPALWESQSVAQTVMEEMWSIADIALPSIDDERNLYGDESDEAVVARFGRKTWKACAVKCGENGPISPTLGVAKENVFPPAEKVVDTTAAGDSFNGGYLAAFLNGQDEMQCLQAGHECASYVVGVPGAISPAGAK